MSKAALNCGGVTMSRDLKDAGIAVALIHPGAVSHSLPHLVSAVSWIKLHTPLHVHMMAKAFRCHFQRTFLSVFCLVT